MDPNAAPWRVLEDPVETTPGGTKPDGDRAPSKRPVRESTLVVGVVAIALAVGAFVLAAGSSTSGSVAIDGGSPLPGASADVVTRTDAPGGPGSASILVVEIVGAVDNPGVFRLPRNARVGDLVAAAGGYGPRVDTERAARDLNLAAPLRDGDQIRVPSRDDPVEAGPATTRGGSAPRGSSGPPTALDLNRATAEELDTLPGIGPATAAKILASRDEQPFATVDDLRSRKLVGEKTFANLKELVTVH